MGRGVPLNPCLGWISLLEVVGSSPIRPALPSRGQADGRDRLERAESLPRYHLKPSEL